MPRWTPQSRRRQSELCQQQQPWLSATGPVSSYGKRVSSENSRKPRQHRNVSPVSLSATESDRPLQTGDRVRYIGNFQPTFEACVGEPLEVLGLAGGAIACRTSTGKLIWIYPQDLERIS